MNFPNKSMTINFSLCIAIAKVSQHCYKDSIIDFPYQKLFG